MHNFSFSMASQGHNNATLSYAVNGRTYYANVRVSKTSYTYGVVSTESHSRRFRAFYPHRRALGNFSIVVDCIHYHEYRKLMNWLRNYSDHLLSMAMTNTRHTSFMEVKIPARHFHKAGILTTGISDDDHTASMVFSPTLTFMTVVDFNDKGTAVVRTDQTSQFHLPKRFHGENSPTDVYALYPSSTARYTDSRLYDSPHPPPLPIDNRPPPSPNPGGPVKII